jgi:hypothetical protein
MSEKHSHNGLDSERISSSNVEYNSSNDIFIKSNRTEGAIKDLDKALSKKIKILDNAKSGNLPIINSDGNLVDSNFSLSDFSKIEHNHLDKIDKVKNSNENTIPKLDKEGNITNSNFYFKDLVLKENLKDFQQKIEAKDNDIIIFNKELKSSGININDISKKDHIHDNYIKVINGKNNNIPVINPIGLSDSDISINDICLKKDLDCKINKINGKNGNFPKILDNEIIDSGISLDNLSNKDHTHNLADIKDFNFDQMLKNSSIFRELVKEEIKKFLKEIFS